MKKRSQRFFPFVSLLLGLAASAMVFLPALSSTDLDATYSGVQVITGLSVFNAGPVAEGQLPFSVIALLAYSLPLIAGVLGVALRKGFLVSTILFAAAAILLFVLPQYTFVNVTTFMGGTTEWEVDWVFELGLTLSASFSLAGALFSAFALFKEMK